MVTCPDIVTCNMAYWHIVIECTQAEVESITAVNVYENGEQVTVR